MALAYLLLNRFSIACLVAWRRGNCESPLVQSDTLEISFNADVASSIVMVLDWLKLNHLLTAFLSRWENDSCEHPSKSTRIIRLMCFSQVVSMVLTLKTPHLSLSLCSERCSTACRCSLGLS